MTEQNHTGTGDNVLGHKYENIIRSIQTRDLKSVVDSIMGDICCRNIDKAVEKLKVLSDIDSLESDVKSLLQVIQIKVDLINGAVPFQKQAALSLLKSDTLSNDIRGVVHSILIDLESRTKIDVAKSRYNALEGTNNPYISEVFLERLASNHELLETFDISKKHDLLEQEVTGLIRGALRENNFKLAVEVSQFLISNFPSRNAASLLLYSESCLVITENQSKHFTFLDHSTQSHIEKLVVELCNSMVSNDVRHICTLINLLNLTCFLDRRLIDLGKVNAEAIRKIDGRCAESIMNFMAESFSPTSNFELTKEPLDHDGFLSLHFALEANDIKLSAVKTWFEQGGSIQIGDDYFNAFAELQLTALLCSEGEKQDLQLLGIKAQEFFELDTDRFLQLNPLMLKKLCERFIKLNIPLYAVKYLLDRNNNRHTLSI